MRQEDAAAVYETASTALFESMEEREILRRRTPEQVENRKARYGHFLRHDPDGAWLAEDDGGVSGVAISVVRGRVLVLSLLAVDAAHRGTGLVAEHNGSPAVLAATEPGVARELLWACLERTPPGEKADVDWITGGQNWAVAVTLEAGLSLSPAGPICTRGNLGPLAPYLPSGPFL